MGVAEAIGPVEIRAAKLENQNMRERDLADKLGIAEAQLLAAFVGQGVTRIAGDLDTVMAAADRLGEVMALTRNPSAVIEKNGFYHDFKGGPHAGIIFNGDIDLRMFPKQWLHGFAVEKQTANGLRRSLQIFDAAGDAVHKIFLREASNLAQWQAIVSELKLADQSDQLTVSARKPVEDAKVDLAKTDRLCAEWDKLTDTHQFLMMVRKLKLNRLGAYRMAGAPYVRPLAPKAVPALLHAAADSGTPIMVFVGNMGCIEIHTGPVNKVVEMGPWINVLDPGLDLHLRADHVAEVWCVTKSTRQGPAISVEAFDAEGGLIAQFFGVLRQEGAAEKWNALVADLPELKQPELIAGAAV